MRVVANERPSLLSLHAPLRVGAPPPRGMRRLRALAAALALGGAVAASAEPFDASYDVFDDALAPSPLGSPEAPSFLGGANAWVDACADAPRTSRPRRRWSTTRTAASSRTSRTCARSTPRRGRGPGGTRALAEDESAKVRGSVLFRNKRRRRRQRRRRPARRARRRRRRDAVLGALEVSEEILARTSPDALDAASDVARVIQEQTELAKAALAAASPSSDDDYAADFDFDFDTRLAIMASAAPVSASFAVDPGVVRLLPRLRTGELPGRGDHPFNRRPGNVRRARDGDGDPLCGTGTRRASAASPASSRSAPPPPPRGTRRRSTSPRVWNTRSPRSTHSYASWISRWRARRTRRSGGTSSTRTPRTRRRRRWTASRRAPRSAPSARKLAAKIIPRRRTTASFARGVERAASLRGDDAEREARVRAELNLADVIERQGRGGTKAKRRNRKHENAFLGFRVFDPSDAVCTKSAPHESFERARQIRPA